jgi:hypothetical protein
MSATLEQTELVCPNDRCFGYDVDLEPGQLPRIFRNRWTGAGVEMAGGFEVLSTCSICGTLGKVAE